MTAKFEVHAVVEIRGRGMMIAGWILDGDFRLGNWLSIPGFPRRLIVQGVERVSVDPTARVRPGLIGVDVPVFDEAERSLLKELVVEGQLLEIREDNIAVSYAIAAMVAVAVLNAAAVLLFPLQSPVIGIGLGVLQGFVLLRLGNGLPMFVLLAAVIDTGLSALLLAGYCAAGTHVVCGLDLLTFSMMPGAVMGILLATSLSMWLYWVIRRLFIREG